MGRAYLAISIVTLFWAANFTVGKIATDEFDPLFLAPVRVLVTAAFFFILLPPQERKITRADFRAYFPMALTGIAVNHVCFAVGIDRTTPSHSAILHVLIPVFVAIMAWAIVKEKLRPLGFLGMALAVAGALVVVLPGAREVKGEFQGDLVGDLVTLVGVLAFSFYVAWGRRVVRAKGGLRTLAMAFVFAAPLVAPVLVYGASVQDWSRVTWKGWTAMAYMWVCGNLIAYRLHMFALSRLTAGQVAAFIDIQPAIAITLAVLAGRDETSWPLMAGAVLAIAGVALVQLRR